MEIYLLKFTGCLAVLWLVYMLLLEKQHVHKFKRFYLLGSFLVAALIPLLSITEYIEPIPQVLTTDLNYSDYAFEPTHIETVPVEQSISLASILWVIYGIGVLLFSVQFFWNLFRLFNKISSNEKLQKSSFIHVLLKEQCIPHSFFRYLFFSKSAFESNSIPKEVIRHEETHAKQLHSIDILCIELIQIILWFHPLVYLLKHHIKLNHEFLADQEVLKKGVELSLYQNLLLQFSSEEEKYQFSSAINYSSIKKRFTVMKTQTSNTKTWLSRFLVLPLVALLFYGFAERKTVFKEADSTASYSNISNTKVINAVEIEVKADSTILLNNKVIAFWEIPRKANYINKNLTKEEKQKFVNASILIPNASYLSIAKLIIEELRKVDITSSSTGYLENKAKAGFEPTHFSPYAGKTVEEAKAFRKEIETKLANDSLSSNENSPWSVSYGVSEVSYIKDPLELPENSYITDPLLIIKEDQSLFLNYEPTSLESLKEDFNSITGNKKSNLLLKTEAVVSSDYLEVLADIIGKNLNAFTYGRRDAKISSTHAVPALEQKNQINILKTNKNKNITLLENWFITIDNKKYYYPYKKGDLKKYYDKYGNEVNLDIVKEYLKKYEIFEALKNKGEHFVYKSKAEQKNIEALYSDLGGMYFRMSKSNKAEVKRPNSPVKPYTKITLNGKTYYKEFSKLTAEEKASLPPPPPPPPSKQEKNTFTYETEDGEILEIVEEEESHEGQKEVNSEQLAEYNAWAREMNKAMAEAEKTKEYPIIKLKVLNYFKNIFDNLSTTQRSEAEPFPKKFASIPPPPPPVSKKSKGGPNMTETQELYNPNFLEYIIEMEEAGANFYLDGTKITAQKAKSLAKNNNGKRTEMMTQKDASGRYLVKLSSPEKKKIYARSIELKILGNNAYSIDGLKATKETFTEVFNQLHQDISPELRNKIMNIHVTSAQPISNKETWFIFNSLQDYGFYRIVTPNQEINRAKGNTPFAIESHSSQQDQPTPKQIAEYNKWAKGMTKAIADAQKTKDYPIIKINELNYYKGIYNKLSRSQRDEAVPFPKGIPPVPPPPPPVLPNQEVKKIKDYIEVKPPPPPPMSLKAAIEDLIKRDIPLYYNNEKISPKVAIQLVDNGTVKHVNHKNINGVERAMLSETSHKSLKQEHKTKFPLVNGKVLKTPKVAMTEDEFRQLEISLPQSEIVSFKVKIPGIKTQLISGNKIDSTVINLFNEINDKAITIQIFQIKDTRSSKISPFTITFKK